MELEFWATTDTGCVRERNEDNFLVDPELQLFVVCDGMGGHSSGDVASAMCVRLVREYIVSKHSVLNYFDHHVQDPAARVRMLDMVTEAVRNANAQIMAYAGGVPSRAGMGTTCSLLMLRSNHAFIAHVGDSRIYLRRRDKVSQVTEDHSYVAELVRRGKMSEAEAKVSHNRNALTRAVGANKDLEVASYHLRTEPDDSFLLCSDGLYNYFGDEGKPPMGFFLERDLEVATKNAIRFANQRGGQDNITCLIVHVVPPTQGTSTDFEVVRDALQRTPFLEFCNDRQLIEIIGVSRKFEIGAGKTVKDWSFEKSQLFIVIQGSLIMRQSFLRTNQVNSRILGKGDYFGADAFFGLAQSKVEIETRDQVVLLGIGGAAFERLAEQNASLALGVLWPLAKTTVAEVARLSRGRISRENNIDRLLDEPALDGIESLAIDPDLIDFDIESDEDLENALFDSGADILTSFASDQLSDVYPKSDASADTSRAILPDDIFEMFDADKETVSYDILSNRPDSLPFNLAHPPGFSSKASASSAAQPVASPPQSSAKPNTPSSLDTARSSSASYNSSAFNEFDRANSDPTLKQKNIFAERRRSQFPHSTDSTHSKNEE